MALTADHVEGFGDHVGDHDLIDQALQKAAPLASPAFTGTPTAPTPANADNSSKLATTAFVTTAVHAIGASDVLPSQQGKDGGYLTTANGVATWSSGPPITVVGSSAAPVTSAAALRPNAPVVYWICAAGVTPTNAIIGDLICNIATGAVTGAAPVTTTMTIDNNTSIGTGDGQVQYTGSDWTLFNDGTHVFHYCSTTGDSLTLRFTGIGIVVRGVKEPNSGIPSWSLDSGAQTGTFDTYNASVIYDQTWLTLTGLANTTHTLVITDTGAKNPSAGGAGGFDFGQAIVTQSPGAVVAGGGGTGGGGGGTATAGPRSGLAWRSGLWAYNTVGSGPGYTTAEKYQETQRGRLVDIVRGAQYANQWQDLAGNIPTFYGLQILDFLDDYGNQAGGPVPSLMLPPWPSNIGGTWAAAAAGSYDSFFQAMGASVAHKRPTTTTYIELAWEANGTWYDWSLSGVNSRGGGGAANFIAGWSRAVNQMRIGAGSSAAPHMKFVYTMSLLDAYGGDPLTVTYPGDSVVDIIGTDQYDWNPATTSDTVPARATDYQRIYDFCSAHGKKMAFPEWGLHHTGAANEGGDNPHFIRAMFTWMAAHADLLEFDNYFQDDALNNVNSGLFSPNVNNNPNSRAAYLTKMA